MQIFNTLTRKKEEFVPQKPGEYRIYVCGPTVYNYIHIGNARPVVVFDTLRRYLEYRGNKVLYVSNITDIDDKLIKKAQEQGCTMKEVAEKFEAEFIRDSDGLNAMTPTVRPRATEHIEEILAVEGIDVGFIGPNDMTQDYGILNQFDHPEIVAAFRRVIAAARASGKYSGVHFGAAAPLEPWLREGMQMNMWNSDNGLLALGAAGIEALRGKGRA